MGRKYAIKTRHEELTYKRTQRGVFVKTISTEFEEEGKVKGCLTSRKTQLEVIALGKE